MKRELVVAKFQEDTAWTELVDDYKITIYTKGVDLPNIGRESSTYLHHIINNYKNLADITVFCQGDPFTHYKDFINQLQKTTEETSYKGFSDFLATSDGNGCPHHCGLRIAKFEQLMGLQEYPLIFDAGAQFLVRKEKIFKYGLAFWKYLYNLHEEEEQMPWILERYWRHLLD